jgi:DNA-binding protein HU-beta
VPAADGQVGVLVGLGTFKSVRRAAREGRNPATGETLQIAASVLSKFALGTPFKE